MTSSELELTGVNEHQLLEMMTWFRSESELKEWAGPNFTYPYNANSFAKDLNLDRLDSFSLLNHKREFVAFGQCYKRLQSCHLGRLAVAPTHRGNNYVADLIHHLIEFGKNNFSTRSCSLFVLEQNSAAISAYQKYGFKFANYPDPIPFENCLYMLKQLDVD